MDEYNEFSLDGEEAKGPPGDEKPKVIVQGRVVKQSLFKRFAKSIFVAGPRDVKESIVSDVLIPAIKDFVADSFYTLVDVAIYGRGGGGIRRGRSKGGKLTSEKTDYSSASTRRSKEVSRTSETYGFDDIWFDDRRECDVVYDKLLEELEDHGFVSVYYYFEICGKTAYHTDQHWGWYSLEGTGYRRSPEGWSLSLPKPEQRKV